MEAHILTANKSGFVSVFDVSNPQDPVLHDVLDTSKNGGLGSPHGLAATRDHILVANTGRSEPVHVRLYRITDPAGEKLLPAAQWKQEGFAPSERDIRRDWTLQGANRVAVRDRFAAVGAFVPDRIGFFEIPAPGRLVQVANLPACDIDATGMTISGSILFVAGGECVEAIDVSDPARPVSVAQYRGGDLFPTRALAVGDDVRYDNGHDLVYRDGYLYVTAQNDHRLGILQLLSPQLIRKARPN